MEKSEEGTRKGPGLGGSPHLNTSPSIQGTRWIFPPKYKSQYGGGYGQLGEAGGRHSHP